MSATYEYEPELASEASRFAKGLAAKCNQRKTNACRWLLRMHAEGIGAKKNIEKSVKLAVRMCKTLPGFCTLLSAYQRKYRYHHPKKHAAHIYKRACHWGHGPSCFRWGRVLISLQVMTPRQTKLAQKAFKLGCTQKSALSCYHLALAQIDDVVKSSLGGRNKAVKPMLRACSYKLMPACLWLAKAFQYGDGPDANCSIARALFDYAKLPPPYCETKPQGIHTMLTPRYKVVGALAVVARMLLSRNRIACTEGRKKSCGLLGDLVAEGWEEGTHPHDARPAYAKSCSPTYPNGCAKYAHWLLYTMLTPKSVTKAQGILAKACKQGSGWACALQMKRLHDKHNTPSWFVPMEAAIQKQIKHLLTRACHKSHGPSCRALATQQANPLPTPQLLRKGCRLGDGASCYLLAQRHFVHSPFHKDRPLVLAPKAQAEVKELHKQGCQHYDGPSCYALANALTPKQQQAIPPAACEALRIGCMRNVPMACVQLAKTLRERGEKAAHTAARKLLERICSKQKLGIACGALAVLMQSGEGGPWEPQKARELFKKTCKDGRVESCIAMAKMQVHGMGGPLQRKLGIKTLEGLCERRIPGACGPWSRALQGSKKALETKVLPKLLATCLRKDIGACLALHTLQQKFAKNAALQTWQKAKRVPTAFVQTLREKFKRGCQQLQHSDCMWWAKINELGWGEAPSKILAERAYILACQRHQTHACTRLAKLYSAQKPKLSLILTIRACEQSGLGCYKAATTLYKNWKRYYSSYKRYKRYTYRSYKRYRKNAEKYRDRILKFYRRACTQGHGQACGELGTYAMKGKSNYGMLAKSRPAAIKYFARACALQLKEGCSMLKKARDMK